MGRLLRCLQRFHIFYYGWFLYSYIVQPGWKGVFVILVLNRSVFTAVCLRCCIRQKTLLEIETLSMFGKFICVYLVRYDGSFYIRQFKKQVGLTFRLLCLVVVVKFIQWIYLEGLVLVQYEIVQQRIQLWTIVNFFKVVRQILLT
eukprot:TRINITY_DN4036_c0_g2_i11.p5 TRINITY_DN4036_c0_g2~~TRINITY_DN4036_c0_g2_i11.p5  ORF type:complete len:145 (-),score=0.93 TRINITY_DN4036_c0_g2_i11:42-476(-)